MKHNDTGSHRPALQRGADGIWRLVERGASLDPRTAPTPSAGDPPPDTDRTARAA